MMALIANGSNAGDHIPLGVQSQYVVHTWRVGNQTLVEAASAATVWPAKGRIGLDAGLILRGAWVLDERLLAFRVKGGSLTCSVVLSGS